MGKVMSYVFTLSMCAQPVGQIVYGALFDRFCRQCLLGTDSKRFDCVFDRAGFRRFFLRSLRSKRLYFAG